MNASNGLSDMCAEVYIAYIYISKAFTYIFFVCFRLLYTIPAFVIGFMLSWDCLEGMIGLLILVLDHLDMSWNWPELFEV